MPSAHLCRALHRLGVASLGSREPSAFTLLPHFTGEGTAVKEVKGLVAELTDDERAGTPIRCDHNGFLRLRSLFNPVTCF